MIGSATRKVVLFSAIGILMAVQACQAPIPPSPAAATAVSTPRGTPTAQSTLQRSIPPESLRGIGVEVWHPWLGVEASLLETLISQFNHDNEWGITVRAKGHTNFTELYDRVTDALSAGDGPQLVIALPEHAANWDAAGDVVDLSDYVSDPDYGMGGEEVSDFPAVFWDQDATAGRRLGVPAQRGAYFLIYNQSWARDLGFEHAPESGREFREQACAAHTSLAGDDDAGNDSEGGWLIDTNSMTFLSWLTAFGGGVMDGSGYRFLSPKNLEAATFVKQVYDDGCAWLGQASQDPPAAFANRETLFATAGLEELPNFGRAMAEADNPDEWTVLSFPGAGTSAILTYGSSLVVLKATPERQLAAWLFSRWLLSAENQKRWVEATGLFPLRASVVKLTVEYARSHPQWAAALEYLPEAQIQPQLPSWRQVRVMVGDGFDAMFRSNTPAGRVAEILAIMDRTASDLSQ